MIGEYWSVGQTIVSSSKQAVELWVGAMRDDNSLIVRNLALHRYIAFILPLDKGWSWLQDHPLDYMMVAHRGAFRFDHNVIAMANGKILFESINCVLGRFNTVYELYILPSGPDLVMKKTEALCVKSTLLLLVNNYARIDPLRRCVSVGLKISSEPRDWLEHVNGAGVAMGDSDELICPQVNNEPGGCCS